MIHLLFWTPGKCIPQNKFNTAFCVITGFDIPKGYYQLSFLTTVKKGHFTCHLNSCTQNDPCECNLI